MKKTKPRLWFTDQATRDIESSRLFLQRQPRGQPARRIAEIKKAARALCDSPELYPVEHVHPVSGLEFRRKNVGQFAIIYAYIEPTTR